MNTGDVLRDADVELEKAQRLLDVAVVAHRLGVSASTVRNWIAASTIHAIQSPGGKYRRGKYRIPASELSRLLKLRTESPIGA